MYMSQWKCQKWHAFWPTLDIINLSKPLKCYTWRWSTQWYLTYCNITWASNYPTRLNPILKTQKKLIRNMTFSRYTEKSGPLFKSLKILNIFDCFELNAYLTAVFMYSHHHEKLPAFLDNLFKTNKSVHSCNTRSAANIHNRDTQREYSSKPLKHRTVKRTLVFKR